MCYHALYKVMVCKKVIYTWVLYVLESQNKANVLFSKKKYACISKYLCYSF